MTVRIGNVTIHACDPQELARFWSGVMGYPFSGEWPAELEAELRASGFTDDDLAARSVAWDDDPAHQRFYFPRYRHGEKRHRNRMHLDIQVVGANGHATKEELDAELERLLALGATLEKTLDGMWGPYHEYAHMLRDPEGNEFCIQ